MFNLLTGVGLELTGTEPARYCYCIREMWSKVWFIIIFWRLIPLPWFGLSRADRDTGCDI